MDGNIDMSQKKAKTLYEHGVLCVHQARSPCRFLVISSNFKKHLDTVHKTTALVAIERNTEEDSSTSKRKRSHDEDVEIAAP